ncbi:MAG: O-antigen ligase family protein [Micrococcales bacterium]|nr:O-antigen ligase family protein [Micrococcales bacterium]
MLEKLESSLGRILGWGLIATTLLVTPLWALDPINPIKMLVVVPVGFMCLALILANRKSVSWGSYKIVLGLIGAFVVWQVLVVLISGGEPNQQLFGSQGRNTGLITYVAFSLVFLGSVIASNEEALKRLVIVVSIVGTASLGYGVIQAVGADPFNWVNPYSPVFGFLGNPNFQSSLLGILGAIVFAQLFDKGLKIQLKALIGIYLLVTLYVIKETASQQGFLVLALGIGVVVGFYVVQLNRGLGIGYGVLSILGFFVVLFGTLNKGPLASILYKDSVTYRGDYWQAGWNMTLDHPIFGVGMDSYGDWYRRSRTLAATLRRGPDTTSNAAHNVFLDISSYGGFPLLIIYVALVALVVVSAIKVLKRNKGFNPVFAGLVGGWVAFQAQSIISINQIGLAMWGWVLSGLIIGYEINTRNVVVAEPVAKKGRIASKPAQTSAGSVVALFVAFVLGVLVGMPPYVASARYKSALETSNPTVIQEAAYIWPLDSSRMIQVAMTLNENKLEAQGLEVALDAIKKFPNNYSVWATLDAMKSATAEQRAQAQKEMKRLDPLNPNLK